MENDTSREHSECLLYPDQPNRCKVIKAIHHTSSSLSLIGCVLVAALIIIQKKYKLFVQKMILAMVISAFFGCISYLIGDVHTTNEYSCRLQAVLTQYFAWAVLLWILVITVNMLLVVKNYNNTKLTVVYHAVVWCGALFWTIIPLIGDAYGKAGIWCWIKRELPGYRFGTFYGPDLFLIVLLIAMYIWIIYIVRQNTRPGGGHSVEQQNMNKRYRDELKPLMWYPFVYLILVIPSLSYRIEDTSHPSDPPNYVLIILAVICGPSIGAVIALVFTAVNSPLNEVSWQTLKEETLRMFRKRREPKVVHDYSVDEIQESRPSSGYASNPLDNDISLEMGSIQSEPTCS